MKRKVIILIPVVVILVVAFVYFQLHNKNKHFSFLTQSNHYSVVLTEQSKTFEVLLYSSKKDTMYMESKAIHSTYLISNHTNDELLLNVNSIKKLNRRVEVDQVYYHVYEFSFSTNIAFEDHIQPLYFPNAAIKISYTNGEVLNFYIGEVTLLKVNQLGTPNQSQSDLRISNIKGLVNNVGDYQTLIGVELKISKDVSTNVIIKKIELLSTVIEVNYDYVRVNEALSSFTSSAIEVFGPTYHIGIKGEMDSLNYDLIQNEVTLILPLTYFQANIPVNEVVLYIEYEINDVNKYYIFGSFCFFNTTSNMNEWKLHQYERN